MSNRRDIAIATVTFCPDPQGSEELFIRADLYLQLVSRALEFDYPLIIVDAASHEPLVEQMKDGGAYVFPQEGSGMGFQRRQAMELALGMIYPHGVVLWTEPEKYGVVQFARTIADPILRGEADFVSAARQELSSYPEEQRYIEMFTNLVFYYLTGMRWDVMFGPFAAGVEALQLFMDYDGHYGQGGYGDTWHGVQVPRLRLLAQRFLCEEVVVDYRHDPRQVKFEQGNPTYLMKRVHQAHEIVQAFVAEARTISFALAA